METGMIEAACGDSWHDQPKKSLAARIAECCPCRVTKSNCGYAWCLCKRPDGETTHCRWPGHALEAEVACLEKERFGEHVLAQEWQGRAESAEKRIAELETHVQNEIAARQLAQEHGIGDRARIEELEQRIADLLEVLREAPEPENGDHLDYFAWHKRARAAVGKE
jgi:hypothetical protein